MADVVLDTDMASAFQKGRAPDWAVRHVLGARVWLSFVTVGELSKWAEVRSWGGRRRGELEVWTVARPVIPYDAEVARTWGRLTCV